MRLKYFFGGIILLIIALVTKSILSFKEVVHIYQPLVGNNLNIAIVSRERFFPDSHTLWLVVERYNNSIIEYRLSADLSGGQPLEFQNPKISIDGEILNILLVEQTHRTSLKLDFRLPAYSLHDYNGSQTTETKGSDGNKGVKRKR